MNEDFKLLERYSSLSKLINATAYYLRFICNIKAARELRCVGREGRHIVILRCGHQRPDPTKGWGMAAGGKEKKKKKNEVPVPSAQEPKAKGKLPRRSPAARSGDAIRVSAKDGESYAEILKAMKAKVSPQNAGAHVLSIWRIRREEILLVLEKGGDVSAFEKALDQAVGEKAEINSLVSKRSLEDLDETVTREEVVALLCIALGKPELGDQCRLYKRFGGVQTAVVRLTEGDARSLLGLGRLRVGWVNCRIREHGCPCFRCQGYVTENCNSGG